MDTLGGGYRVPAGLVPAAWRENRYVRSLVRDGYAHLSYVVDWLEAFREAPELEVESCNVNNLLEYRRYLRRLAEFPLAVILHSAAGDSLAAITRAEACFQSRRGMLVVFFGNEYTLMPEKIGFARRVGADYIASQLPVKAAEWLYEPCARSTVLAAPAALNPAVYRPEGRARPIDVGFRGDLYPYSLGDVERTAALRYFRERSTALGLVSDIEFVRCPREEWSLFLNRCRGIVGAESGTYYLERDDRTQQAVSRYLRRHPGASFAEVHARFFDGYPSPVSGKAISSRHFEPIGTRTCQILLEGHYNGILEADRHYLALRKDLANIDEVVRRFRDDAERTWIAEQAYQHVLAEHTYRHRVDAILAGIGIGSARSKTV
jgi:hypothetical protein